MQLFFAAYVPALLLTAIIATALGLVAWKRRAAAPASTLFAMIMLAIAFYAVVAAAENASVTLATKRFWSTLEYVGSGSVITLFLLFALKYAGHTQWLRPRIILALCLLPIANLLLVATNPWHQLVWTAVVPGPPGSNLAIYEHGPGFFWIMACVYLYVVLGLLVLTRAAFGPVVLPRRQTLFIFAGAIIPLLGATAYAFDLTPPGLNVTPMSFLLSGIVYFVALFHVRVFDLVPIARDSLVEHMRVGVLVADSRYRVVDLNPAACQLLDISTEQIGHSILAIPALQAELARLFGAETWNADEPILLTGAARYLELTVMPLYNPYHAIAGWMVMINDVTRQYLAEQQLRTANADLLQQVHRVASLRDRLYEQAIRDNLTGLFNRRYFEERLMMLLAQAKRENQSVAVILLDIDYFKRINDTYGHHAGDRVLQHFSDMLRKSTRTDDIVCRWGGEEFVVALPAVSLTTAWQRAEMIRISIRSQPTFYDNQAIYVTVSGGIGSFPEHGTTNDTLLRAIDQALYAAKAEGRDQVRQAIALPNPTCFTEHQR